jgi:iron(III) transport system permease protein
MDQRPQSELSMQAKLSGTADLSGQPPLQSEPRIALRTRLEAMISGERLLWVVLAIVVIIIAIVPLVYVIDSTFYKETRVGLSSERSLVAFLDVYAQAEYYGYLAQALLLAALVTLLSLGFGVSMALFMARTDVPFKATLDILVIMPLFVSPFTGLISWIVLGSQKTGFLNGMLNWAWHSLGITGIPAVNIWSFGGVIWVMFLFFCPFAYLFTVGAMRTMDSSLEEAARMNGATALQTLCQITLPMSLPSVMASGLIVFILSAEMYTIPGIIGANAGFTTLPWKIFEDSSIFPVHRAHAAAAGAMLLAVTAVGLWLQRRLTRRAERFVTVTGKGFKTKPLALGKLRWAAFALFLSYILFADILPFASLIASSFMKYSAPSITLDNLTLAHYSGMLQSVDLRNALWNTIVLALASGVVCVCIGFLISFMDVRRKTAAAKLLSFLGTLPIAVPGLVYGIGLLWLYLKTPIYGSIWILFLAYIAKFLPYGIVVSRSGIQQIHPDLEQSARMCGASALTATRVIVMPLMKGTLIGILFFVMLSAIKELSASVLLSSQDNSVLSVLTWNYIESGDYQYACALGVVQTVLMIGLVMITRFVFRVKLENAVN